MKRWFDSVDAWLDTFALWELGMMAVGAAVLIFSAACCLATWWALKGWPR